MKKLKIVCISDTHNRHWGMKYRIPDGDVLIHAGDGTVGGSVEEVREFADWFESLPHKHKVFVAGNHDRLYENHPKIANSLLPALQDEAVEIEGLKIYGSPWQPEFHNWAFNLPRGAPLRKVWAKIPDDTDILVTHTPPKNILDLNPHGAAVGCEELFKVVMRVKPKLHVFGHLHGCYGKLVQNGTMFINAAICDEAYRAVRKPIVFEVQ